ncbi:MAG: response regulator [Chitinophagaceae bacterium]|nr:MAG: response regulator [Chitinophagaceae bacterium]
MGKIWSRRGRQGYWANVPKMAQFDKAETVKKQGFPAVFSTAFAQLPERSFFSPVAGLLKGPRVGVHTGFEAGHKFCNLCTCMNCMLPSGKRYLAYVEDDEDDIELFREVAESAGLEVVSFPNGQELLQSLNDSPASLPCLILLDLQNPVITGPETYARLQADERFSKVPVKYFSNSAELMARESRDTPEIELITKPDIYSEWLTLVERLQSFCLAQPSADSV